MVEIGIRDLLLVVDLQNDFCPGGALAVNGGDEILPLVNQLLARFPHSGFFENDRRTPTGLAGYLRERGIGRIFLAGLALDFCVYYTALDGRRLGFEVAVLQDACRGIDLEGSLAEATAEMSAAGVELMSTRDLPGLRESGP